MNKHPMSLPSSVTVPSNDRELEHHPLDRRAVAIGPSNVGTTVAPEHAAGLALATPDMRVMVALLNDALSQVSLLRAEVSDLRRKLEVKIDDWGTLPSDPRTGTIHVSVRTGPTAAQPERRAPAAPAGDAPERRSSFDWDAWQRETKARIRRAMTYQTLSSGQALSSGQSLSSGALGAVAD